MCSSKRDRRMSWTASDMMHPFAREPLRRPLPWPIGSIDRRFTASRGLVGFDRLHPVPGPVVRRRRRCRPAAPGSSRPGGTMLRREHRPAARPAGTRTRAAPRPRTTRPPTTRTTARRSSPGRGGPNTLDVTIVLPCYNEQDHVMAEIERISRAMDATEFSYELLVIDDKSTDGTLKVLQDALPHFPHMRLMPFRRNGGSGTARRIGTARGVRADRGLDRRRHDVPERADPRVRAVPARQPGRRPGGRRPDHRAGHPQVPPGAGEVGDPQGRRAARADQDPGPQLGPAGLPPGRLAALPAAAAARLLLRHDDHHVVPVQPAPGGLPADRLRQAGRGRRSSTS